MIHQNPAHHLGACGEEVRAVVPFDVFLRYQAQIGFVNKIPALPTVVIPLATQTLLCQPSELGINQRREFGARSFVALGPFSE